MGSWALGWAPRAPWTGLGRLLHGLGPVAGAAGLEGVHQAGASCC